MMGEADNLSAELLLVEDNEGDVLLAEEALRPIELPISMSRVADGLEALAFLRREDEYVDARRPALILLDLNMPRMDGREFLQIIKNDADFRIIPVVVLTTSGAEQDMLRCYELQANCCITKHVDFQQFSIVMEQLIRFWFGVAHLPLRK